MKSIHSKAFLDVWRALYHLSNPGPTADRWHWDGIDWIRETYRVATRDYAFHVETHILQHQGTGSTSWSLLVVVERWWQQGRREPLKTSEWRQVLAGRDHQIISWFDRQRANLDARFSDRSSGTGK